MTESERDVLMPFLRKLVASRDTPGDEAASHLIATALSHQPNASYLLVQRALTLEIALVAAQQRILHLEGRAPLPVAAAAPADFLDPHSAGWGEGRTQAPVRSSAKRLYDFFKENQTQHMDMESRALSFISRHNIAIWLFIVALWGTVLLFKDKLV